MATLSAAQIAKAMHSAGFTPDELTVGTAVALAESGGRTNVTNSNTNGSVDYGLFQINSVHDSILQSGDWRDPTDNARMAQDVFNNAANSWSPWVTYDTGDYRQELDRARTGVAQYGQNKGIDVPTGNSGQGSSNNGQQSSSFNMPNVGEFFSMVTNPTFWVRLLMVFAGGIVLVIGIYQLATSTRAGQEVVSDVGDAADIALTTAGAYVGYRGIPGRS